MSTNSSEVIIACDELNAYDPKDPKPSGQPVTSGFKIGIMDVRGRDLEMQAFLERLQSLIKSEKTTCFADRRPTYDEMTAIIDGDLTPHEKIMKVMGLFCQWWHVTVAYLGIVQDLAQVSTMFNEMLSFDAWKPFMQAFNAEFDLDKIQFVVTGNTTWSRQMLAIQYSEKQWDAIQMMSGVYGVLEAGNFADQVSHPNAFAFWNSRTREQALALMFQHNMTFSQRPHFTTGCSVAMTDLLLEMCQSLYMTFTVREFFVKPTGRNAESLFSLVRQ